MTNQWVHLAGVKRGNTLELFQNGVSLGTVTETRSLSSTCNFFMGAFPAQPTRSTRRLFEVRSGEEPAEHRLQGLPPPRRNQGSVGQHDSVKVQFQQPANLLAGHGPIHS